MVPAQSMNEIRDTLDVDEELSASCSRTSRFEFSPSSGYFCCLLQLLLTPALVFFDLYYQQFQFQRLSGSPAVFLAIFIPASGQIEVTSSSTHRPLQVKRCRLHVSSIKTDVTTIPWARKGIELACSNTALFMCQRNSLANLTSFLAIRLCLFPLPDAGSIAVSKTALVKGDSELMPLALHFRELMGIIIDTYVSVSGIFLEFRASIVDRKMLSSTSGF